VLILLTTIDSFNSLNQNNLVVLSLFMYIVNFRPKLNPCAEKCDLYALGKEGYNCCCFVVALQENTHYVSLYVPVWRPLFLLWTRSRPMKILFCMSWVLSTPNFVQVIPFFISFFSYLILLLFYFYFILFLLLFYFSFCF